MKRILHIVDSMGQGGIQAFIMNVYENVDREQVQFDFLLHKKLDNHYEKRIIELGGRIYYVFPRNKGILKNYISINAFFKQHTEYQVVHMHESSLAYLTPLQIAKHYCVKQRIIHSHSSRVIGSKINRVLHAINKLRINKIATTYLACGQKAGDWFYSGSAVENKYTIITNGIDLEKFKYDEAVRNEVREELSINNGFVLGHVGRFNAVKNHNYIIDIFNEFLRMKVNSYLLLIGDGELRPAIEEKVRSLGLTNQVIFTGIRNDIHRLYQAMDCLILPSLYEGFPVTAIEAQASGLPCILSDSITSEVMIKGNVKQASITCSPVVWADIIMKNDNKRIKDNICLIEHGLDIKDTVRKLMEVYGLHA